MSKSIAALCDKIIELDEAHKKRPYAYTGDFYDECENHAAKLARALLKSLEYLNQIEKCECHEAYTCRQLRDPNCLYCLLSPDEYKKEIEEIFK